MLNLDRSPARPSDVAALDGVVTEWRRKEYCPGKEAKAIQALQRHLWRQTRALSRDYRLALDLQERRSLWPQLEPWVKKCPKVKPSLGPWSMRLTTIITQLRAFDPNTMFPQPDCRTTRVRLRSELIRKAHVLTTRMISRRYEARDAAAATMVAGFLRATCPDLCHDVTPEQVRKLVQYTPGKNKP